MKNLLLSLAAFTTISTSCGRQQQTEHSARLSDRSQVPTDNIELSDVQDFIDQASTVSASTSLTGAIPVIAFLKLMPLLPDARASILKSFTKDFAVKCNAATSVCSVITSGSPTQAVMDVVIDGISNPSLVLDQTVTSDFVIRDATSIEFCNTRGLSVKKFFIKKTAQGLFLSANGGQPDMTVNTGNDSENYTCR